MANSIRIMTIRSPLILILAFVSLILAVTTPPAGAVVATAGSNLQNLIDANPGKTIFLQAGRYNGPIVIKSKMTLIGSSEKPDSYDGNKATITIKRSQKDNFNNDQTAALQIHADGVKVYNVNVENTYGSGSQALALSTMGDQIGLYGCKFSGFQDTVETEGAGASRLGRQVFAKCWIEGATDFIFGKSAAVWIEDCHLQLKSEKSGYITAQGRDSESNQSGFVINNSVVSGGSSKTFYLGRPWRQFARVTFQNSQLGDAINPDGWAKWVKSVTENGKTTQVADPTDELELSECRNTGPGASTAGRVKWSNRVKTCPEKITTWLGSNYENWVDMKFMRR